jgi:cyclohexa-1,5-dienecarbonyl-CoA hydratase
MMSGTDKVKLEFEHEGQVARVTLAAPKANIIDCPMMVALESAFNQLAERRALKAVVITGDGPNFSFGASVQEHLPEQISETLTRLHRLIRQVSEAPAPTIAAVRGQCLGGGLELALSCDLILAEETAQLGCPEIQLGVFPPKACALLPVRIGSGAAANLVLTGARIDGSTAVAIGLVNRTAASGKLEAALTNWLATEFLPRSACALRCAARAVRRPLVHALEQDLSVLERMYLSDLLKEPDAVEGIRAFLEKRPPRWGGSGATA